MPKPELGLYIHWPFCASKCPYCDFNSHVVSTVDHDQWAKALSNELTYMAEFSNRRGDHLSSIFFGGGTPSMMAPKTMDSLINTAVQLFSTSPDIEITMEANPTSVEAGKLNDFAATGANRLSMGIQSLDDQALQFLGREHSSHEALAALSTARQSFGRVSADFIYARPDHHPDDWAQELTQILNLNLDHLSLYQLTLEKGTAFWSKNQRGLLDVPDDHDARLLFDVTRQMTSDASYPAYEVSNHARAGQECRHNIIYWTAQDWLGVGPGAYGRFFRNNIRTETRSRRDPMAWLDDVQQKSNGIDSLSEDSPIDYAHEAMMMGLRLTDGVDISAAELHAGPADDWLDQHKITRLIEEGFLEQNKTRLRLTTAGEPLLNTILNEIIKD